MTQNFKLHEKPNMTISQAFKAFWTHYSDFKGKASRSEFWWNILIVVLVYFVSWFMGLISASPQNGYLFLFHMILTIYTIAIFVPLLSVATRRYHSAGYSGVLLAIYTIIMSVDYAYYICLKVANEMMNRVQDFIGGPMRSMSAAGQLQPKAPHHITLVHNAFGMSMPQFLMLILIIVAILQIYMLIQPSAKEVQLDNKKRAYNILNRSKSATYNTPNYNQKPASQASLNKKPEPNKKPVQHSLSKHPGHWIRH